MTGSLSTSHRTMIMIVQLLAKGELSKAYATKEDILILLSSFTLFWIGSHRLRTLDGIPDAAELASSKII